MNATAHPGEHLVAHFQSSRTDFPQYHAAALDLAAKDGSDTVAHARLVRLVAQYLQHLHIHHTAEEVELFPAIRRAAPDLSDSVDSLLDQHHELAAHLETVTDRLVAVSGTQPATAERAAALDDLVRALTTLDDVVTVHLAFEESITIAVISSWTNWPF